MAQLETTHSSVQIWTILSVFFRGLLNELLLEMRAYRVCIKQVKKHHQRCYDEIYDDTQCGCVVIKTYNNNNSSANNVKKKRGWYEKRLISNCVRDTKNEDEFVMSWWTTYDSIVPFF